MPKTWMGSYFAIQLNTHLYRMCSPRILHVITRSDWGGAARVVKSLATETTNVAAVACGPGGRLIDRVKSAGIPVHIQQHLQRSPSPKDILAYRDLRQLIFTGDFDLVHAHSTKAGALARLAAHRAGVPSIFTVHGWGFYNTEYGAVRPLVIRGEQLLETCTEEIVCVSRYDYEQGKHHRILSEKTGTVIHNGIPPLRLPANRTTIYDEFGIDQNRPVIGAIGRLAPQKDPLEILEAATKLRNRGKDLTTVLIGSGPLEEDCRQYIDSHDMKNTYILGFIDNALQFLPDFDVFLLPSRFEGFPLTVLECMHAGVPLVANDVGGVAEAVEDGVTGFVVSPAATTGCFVDRVEELLENEHRRHKMGQRAQQIAIAKFTEERMAAEYQTLYQEIISNS